MKLKLLLAMLVFGAISTHAQIYNLPNGNCNLQGTSFLYCSNMGNVNIDRSALGIQVQVGDVHRAQVGRVHYPVVPYGSFNLIEINPPYTHYTMTPLSGTYVDHHLTVNFTGAFNGKVDLDLTRSVQPPPCGRGGCRVFWNDENVVLTLD